MLFVPVEKPCNFCSGRGMATMVEIMVVGDCQGVAGLKS